MRLGGLVRPRGQGLRKPIDTFEINPSARMGRESATVHTVRKRALCGLMQRPPKSCTESRPSHPRKGLTGSRDGPATDSNIARERASHPKPTVLSDFILGSQDGIVNVLGIILGLSAATRDVRIILVATLAALGAESIAMGAVAYTSTRARRRLYLSQALQERPEMKEIPKTERDEA